MNNIYKYFKSNIITDNIISFNNFSKLEKNINRLNSVNILFQSTFNKKIALDIEEGIIEYAIWYIFKLNNIEISEVFFEDICNVYEYKFNSILNYLQNVPCFLNNILSKSINSKFISFLTPQEIDFVSFKKILEKKQKREEKMNNIVYSDVYCCRRCKQKKCISKIIATRAADESLTTIVQCHNCYNVFTV